MNPYCSPLAEYFYCVIIFLSLMLLMLTIKSSLGTYLGQTQNQYPPPGGLDGGLQCTGVSR